MIRPKVQLKGNFKATAALRAAFAKAKGSHVDVGVQKDAGSYGPTKKQPNPPTVAQVALWMEYGTRYAPARPFLNPAVDDGHDILAKAMAEGLVGIGLHGWSVEKGLSRIGMSALVLVQNRLLSNVGPALTGTWDPPSGYLGYKRAQGMGQRTLVATGLLYRSLTFKVQLAQGQQGESKHGQQAGPPIIAPAEDPSLGRAQARATAKLLKAQQRAQRQAFDQSRWKGERADGRKVTVNAQGTAVRTGPTQRKG